MKITLYTPDGTAETFTDCELVKDDDSREGVLAFSGLNSWKRRVGRLTTLPFVIDPE